MYAKELKKEMFLKALKRLDELFKKPFRLIIGGGGALILADRIPIATMDLNVIVLGIDVLEIASLIQKIAHEQKLPIDWLNPYYSHFTYVLPSDYQKRLRLVFQGKNLVVSALGKEELLLMKCFAHRPKDRMHALYLLKQKVCIDKVEKRLEALEKKGIPGVQEAFDFLDELLEEL